MALYGALGCVTWKKVVTNPSSPIIVRSGKIKTFPVFRIEIAEELAGACSLKRRKRCFAFWISTPWQQKILKCWNWYFYSTQIDLSFKPIHVNIGEHLSHRQMPRSLVFQKVLFVPLCISLICGTNTLKIENPKHCV